MRRLLTLFFVLGILALPAIASHKTQKPTLVVKYVGLASWYGKERQGRRMANGEKFDYHKLTAACWFLPLGSRARVTNLTNGKEVEVVITDRGPATWLYQRIIDLSAEAAKQLDYYIAGTAPIFLRPILEVDTESVPLNTLIDESIFEDRIKSVEERIYDERK